MKLAARTSLLLFKFLAFHAPIVSTVYLLCACMCVLAAQHKYIYTCGCHGAAAAAVERMCAPAVPHCIGRALVSHTIAALLCVLALYLSLEIQSCRLAARALPSSARARAHRHQHQMMPPPPHPQMTQDKFQAGSQDAPPTPHRFRRYFGGLLARVYMWPETADINQVCGGISPRWSGFSLTPFSKSSTSK